MPSGADALEKLLIASQATRKPERYSWLLKPADESGLRKAVRADSKQFLWKACLSFADAIGSVDRKSYSWGVVKLYYATFYALKAWLASADELHIYLNRSPHAILVRSGEKLQVGEGNSHAFIFSRFSNRFPTTPNLSQTIDLEEPLDWLAAMREEQQYQIGGCRDPELQTLFKRWTSGNPNSLFEYYATVPDDVDGYAIIFDVDHAMIAWPARLIADVIGEFKRANLFQITGRQASFASTLCKVNGTPLGAFTKLLRG